MGIKITQPFNFESVQPNFDRDYIDANTMIASHNPLLLTDAEGEAFAKKYDIGHVVWDVETKRHYVFLTTVVGLTTYYCFGIPTVENTIYRLNEVDNEREVLTLRDELEIDLKVAELIYVPITSMPSDWDTNWSKYYVYDGVFKLNTNKTFQEGTTYYIKTYMCI